MRAQREHRASVVIVCSPNNPTGTVLAPDEVARLCRETDALIVVDEAYHEFAGQSVVPLLHEHGNLIVLRTFSKAMAMAGLRVGYLLASPELVAEVNKARLPYNLNFFSQAAALAVLSDPGPVEATSRGWCGRASRFSGDLAAIPGVRPYRIPCELHPVRARGPSAGGRLPRRCTSRGCWSATSARRRGCPTACA